MLWGMGWILAMAFCFKSIAIIHVRLCSLSTLNTRTTGLYDQISHYRAAAFY